MKSLGAFALFVAGLALLVLPGTARPATEAAPVGAVTGSDAEPHAGSAAPSALAPPDTAVFAGGCFWCMEPPYDKLDGVTSTISGYAGGHVAHPSYEQVTAGGTGHREAVLVTYDPDQVRYQTLLDVFWHNVDPLDGGGQFCDRGFSYTTAIFAQNEEQARLAHASKERVEERLATEGFDRKVVTEIITDAAFYPAEGYHQNYYEENSIRYNFYRWSCQRDPRLEELWGEDAGIAGH